MTWPRIEAGGPNWILYFVSRFQSYTASVLPASALHASLVMTLKYLKVAHLLMALILFVAASGGCDVDDAEKPDAPSVPAQPVPQPQVN